MKLLPYSVDQSQQA